MDAFKFPMHSRDSLVPLPERETPEITKNKILRREIVGGERKRPVEKDGGRRKSSMTGRGKRVSSSFENAGVIGECIVLSNEVGLGCGALE
jgi:kinetochore protein Mis13/DSN1